MIAAVRYTGETGVMRLGDRPLVHGETISGPAGLVAQLALAPQFEAIEAPDPEPEAQEKAED